MLTGSNCQPAISCPVFQLYGQNKGIFYPAKTEYLLPTDTQEGRKLLNDLPQLEEKWTQKQRNETVSTENKNN